MAIGIDVDGSTPFFGRLLGFPLIDGQPDHVPRVGGLGCLETEACIVALSVSQRMATQDVGIQSVEALAKVQEFYFLPVRPDRMIDQFDDLFRFDPAVWMKDEIHDSLLRDSDVQRDF